MPDPTSDKDIDIEGLISEKISESMENLLDQVSKQITGLGTKLNKKFSGEIETISGRLSSFDETVEAKLNERLAALNEQAKAEDFKATTKTPTEQSSETTVDIDAKLEAKLNEYKKQAEAQAAQQAKLIRELQKQTEAERQARQEAEMAARRDRLRSNFVSKAGEKVTNPDMFFSVLDNYKRIRESEDGSKLLVELPGQYDELGNPKVIEATADEAIDGLLNDPQFAIFAKPRGGSGVGAVSNGSQPQPTGQAQPKYFTEENLDNADDVYALLKAGKVEDVTTDFNRALNGNR